MITAPLPGVTARSTLLLLVSCALGVVGFGWPFVTRGSGGDHAADAVWLISAVTVLVLGMILAALLDDTVDVKAIALLGVLAAVGAALRPLGAGTAGIEPMFVILIMGGRVLGPTLGFALGNVALLASALLTAGVGPWLPFQMIAAGWVAMGAGLLPGAVRGRAEVALVAGYALIAGFAFGAVMNLWFWPLQAPTGSPISYDPDAGLGNLKRYAAFYGATSLGWDLPRGVLNAALVLAAGPRLMAAIRHAVQRAAFGVPIDFVPPPLPAVSNGSPTGDPLSKGNHDPFSSQQPAVSPLGDHSDHPQQHVLAAGRGRSS